MAAAAALAIIFVIVDGAIVGLTTFGWALLAVTMSAIDFGISQGITGAIGAQTGFSPLVNSLSLQLNANQALQLTQGLQPLLSQPTLELPSHSLPSRQLPDRSIPDRQTPLELTNPQPAPAPNPSPGPGPQPNPNPQPQPQPNPGPGQQGCECMTPDELQTAIQNAFTTFCQQCLNPEIGTPLASLATLVPLITQYIQNAAASSPATAIAQLGTLLAPGLAAIVQAITTQTTTQHADNDSDDAPAALLDYMVQQGLIDSTMGQMLGDPIRLRMDPTRLHPTIRKFLGGDGSGLWSAIQSLAQQWLTWLKANYPTVFANVSGSLPQVLNTLQVDVLTVINEFAKIETVIPETIFNAVVAATTGGTPITAANVEQTTFTMLGTAFIIGQGVHLLAALGGFLGYPMSSIWGNNAAMIIELLDYDSIRTALTRQFFPAAIGERARQKYQSQYRAHVPAIGQAMLGFSRGKLTDPQLDALLALQGMDSQYTPLLEEISYRPISAFILAGAYQNQDIPASTLSSALANMSLSPADQATMSTVITNRAIAAMRQAYVNAVVAGFGKGITAQSDLTAAQQEAQFGQEATVLSNKIALLAQSEALAAMVEREAIAELEAGYITAGQAQALMEAAGLQAWKVNADVTLAQTKAVLKAVAKFESEERTFARRTMQFTWKSILAQYNDNSIDAATLTTGLTTALAGYLEQLSTMGEPAADISIETQLGAAMITAMVTQATATRQGRPRLVYGVLLDPVKAQLLVDQVGGLKEMVEMLDMTPQVAQQQLQSLGIDATTAAALTQAWFAYGSAKGALKPTNILTSNA